jgi:hypothetical protein
MKHFPIYMFAVQARRLLIISVLFLTLVVGNPAFSADFEKGVTAYQSGDYATALREWIPLAEQGDANAQFQIGAMYDVGKGVLKDYKTARRSLTFFHTHLKSTKLISIRRILAARIPLTLSVPGHAF